MYQVSYVSDKPINENVFNTVTKACDITASRVAHTSEIFSLLSNPGYFADCIMLDIDCCFNIKGLTPFDLVNTISTLIECTVYRPSPSSRPVKRATKILIGVCDSTDVKMIKEIKGSKIDGFYPIGPAFTVEEKIQCVRDTLSNDFHIPKIIKEKLSHHKRKKNTDALSLTPRQEQILLLIQQRGASNKVIAKMLHISESTVKLHVTHIFKKFGVKNRTQLAVFTK